MTSLGAWTNDDRYDPGPVCCKGGCCGAGSYCCSHPDNDHEHDPVDDLFDEIYHEWSHNGRTVNQLLERLHSAFDITIKED